MRGKAILILALAALLTPLAALPAGSIHLCFGRAPTINAVAGVTTFGSAGADVILGTDGNDVIYGRGGNDRICGLGGNDTLVGNGGRDRLDGGDGKDTLRGGPGPGNVMLGGAGNDKIIAVQGSNTVRGGPGNDFINARDTGFSVLRGNGGSDTIHSGYRSDLDAGTGTDHCGLGLDVAGTNCETVELLCGSGGDPLPPLLFVHNLTSELGDFDGNGINDRLLVWGSGTDWWAQIQTDGDFGARLDLPSTDAASAIGGHDLNGDGVDEAFVQVGSGAHAAIVGLYTLYEPIGSPATGLSCGMKAVTFLGVAAEAQFAVGASLMNASGLACQANGTLREYQQETADGVAYTQQRFDYDYSPGFAVAPPQLGTPAWSMVSLISPADAAAIYQASRFACGSLDL